MALRVVFAEDNFLVREGVTALLNEVDEIDLVESVADPPSLLKAVRTHRPDAVLTDIRMPTSFTTEGIDAAKQIRAEFPSTGVVVLSQYVEPDHAFDLLADGVSGLGYLLKERVSQVDELVRALEDVARGGSALDPKVVEGLMARKSSETNSPLLGLTEKEQAILETMATGRNNSAIAKSLFMSERAVEKHISSVFQKLGLVDEGLRAELRLRDVCLSSGPCGVKLVRVVGRQKYHHRRIRPAADPPARLDAVDSGQVDVHQHQPGTKVVDRGERLLPCGRGADDDEPVSLLHNCGHGTPIRVLVVDHQDPHVGMCRVHALILRAVQA